MSSTSSSSSLLYINVLLLVLIHSSIQQGILSDAILNARRRLLEAQDLKSEYRQNSTTSENNLNQFINILIDEHPSKKENLKEFKDCQTKIHSVEHNYRVVGDLQEFVQIMESDYRALENEEVTEICRVPRNIDFNVLGQFNELLFEYLRMNYKFYFYKFKESYFSLLTENLKNLLANNTRNSNDDNVHHQ
uniref:Uncharacterized protein n=1 Tax=Schistosoma japonicum TaxID=6182 RepID=C7TZ90_SCHJA|nr:hypothetical protein [Schistosoma japonicum]